MSHLLLEQYPEIAIQDAIDSEADFKQIVADIRAERIEVNHG